jgi:hypothetical protein
VLSNLCCDAFPRLFFREFASHLLASVQRHEDGAGRTGNESTQQSSQGEQKRRPSLAISITRRPRLPALPPQGRNTRDRNKLLAARYQTLISEVCVTGRFPRLVKVVSSVRLQFRGLVCRAGRGRLIKNFRCLICLCDPEDQERCLGVGPRSAVAVVDIDSL